MSQAPETEYIYDEYIEYEEVNATEAPPTLVPVDVTAGEMKASLLTTGNTPTLYAQQKPPPLNLTNAGLGYNDLIKAQKPQPPAQGYNGLSFFGIPLPNLSLGNIWKGRSTETSPYKRGKVQPVDPSARNFVTPNPELETKFETGFMPMTEKEPFMLEPYPSAPANVSSWTLPKEHRTEDQEIPNPGKIEPVYKSETTTTEKYDPPPEIEMGLDFPEEDIENDIKTDPSSDRFMTASSNSWYYQNYNKTNIQPFIERATVTNSAAKHLPSIAMTGMLLKLYIPGMI